MRIRIRDLAGVAAKRASPARSLPGAGTNAVNGVRRSRRASTPNTTYYFKIVATTGEGTGEGEPVSFKTNRQRARGHDRESRRSQADERGAGRHREPRRRARRRANSSGGPARVAHRKSRPCSPQPGSGTGPEAVTAKVTGLTPDTTYYFKLVATGEGGNSEGARKNSTTLADELAVTTGEASAVTKHSATLNGTVNPGGSPVTSCEFEYGTTKGELKSSDPVLGARPARARTPVDVSAEVTGLAPNTTYYFKLVAENEAGASPVPAPKHSSPPPGTRPRSRRVKRPAWARPPPRSRARSTRRAKKSTSCAVEYGTTPALGSSASCPSLPASRGSARSKWRSQVTGLSPGTTYYYRVVAKSPGGEEVGADQDLHHAGPPRRRPRRHRRRRPGRARPKAPNRPGPRSSAR